MSERITFAEARRLERQCKSNYELSKHFPDSLQRWKEDVANNWTRESFRHHLKYFLDHCSHVYGDDDTMIP